jgi:hypothetical protein
MDQCQKSSKDNQVLAEQCCKNKGNIEASVNLSIGVEERNRRIAKRKTGRRISPEGCLSGSEG